MITAQQAAALLVSMVGWEDIAEQQNRRLSPHIATSLMAILGINELPFETSISRLVNEDQARYVSGVEIEKINKLVDLLMDAGHAMRSAIDSELQKRVKI